MKKLNIGNRLAVGFGLLLALTVASTALGAWQLRSATQSTQAIIDQPLAKERLIADWYRYIYTAVRRTTAIAKSNDPQLATYFAAENKQSAENTTAIQKQVEALMQTPEEKQLFQEIAGLRKAYVAARDEIVRLKKDGQAAEADQLLENSFAPAARVYQERTLALLELQRKALDNAADPIRQANERASLELLILGLLGLTAGIGASITIGHSIVRPLRRALALARHVASGDLTTATADVPPDARDEGSHLLVELGAMQQSLTTVISGIRQAADSISTASAEIASGNQDLSLRTEQAASSIQLTAASMEQLTSTVNQSAESARVASGLAVTAGTVAARGGAVVSQVVSTMESINASSRRISDITGVIDGIAFQTNILALNAAVEAARAGDQGRGFAVVASEVRALAQRSAEAAREIKTLTTASVEKVADGSRLVDEAGRTMSEIVASVQRVSDVISSIAAAAQDETSEIQQVNSSVSQLDQMTQQNAALVEQSTAAAQSLHDQARRLTEIVATFSVSGQSMQLRQAPKRIPPGFTQTAPNRSQTLRGIAKTPALHKPEKAGGVSAIVATAATEAADDWETF